MSLLKLNFLPMLGLCLVISTSFHKADGLVCYTCSNAAGCEAPTTVASCGDGETCVSQHENTTDSTSAVTSMSCGTCSADFTCCSSDLCNAVVTTTTSTTTTTTTTPSTTTTIISSSSSTKESSDVTTATIPTTTPKPGNNGANQLGFSLFVFAAAVAFFIF